MINWVLIIFIILILVMIIVYNVINQNEKHALYYPSKKQVWKPKVNYETVYLNVNNLNDVLYSDKDRDPKAEYISAWYLNNFPGAKTIMFCHGNTGNITHRKYIIDLCSRFGLNLIVFDTRGFGESDGFPHKFFLREDGEIVYNFLHSHCKIPSKEIVIWAESLGCVAGVWTASKFKCGGLILLCSFSSLDDAIGCRFKGKSKAAVDFLTYLLSYKMDMIPVKQYLGKVECPVVIIHSKEDELIPYECAKINYGSIRHKEKLFISIRGTHNSPSIKTKQLREIFEFLELPDDLSSKSISYMLRDLSTFAQRHQNFID